MKLQRLQRLQGPFPPAGLQSRKKLYPPSTSHLAGVEGVVVGGGRVGLQWGGGKGGGAKSGALFLPGVEILTKKSRKNCSRRWGEGTSLAALKDGRSVQKVSNRNQT